ncbi:MarR family winged helix-turn-helix transcriptional regulator [Hufsiella ginkgonis]|uniref:MarR family transcriptional regulator n=1 Tax=Hufsiella ginkgonis TaxID=2695274 RepID=A0A7K1Y1U6_9SPHI|nr:MarR family winged helix-turn-helix transcriptional regulator [Hufsiella ginkgonis]MXV17201.1 MarR family transcriptional regulator [Hufsiella ginkgonis]
MNQDSTRPVVFPYGRIEESSGFLVWQIAMCWQRKVNQELAVHGLTYTQFVVLAVTEWLKQKNDNIYQHQVATHARIDRMMTSRVMTSLERKKLLQRVKQSGDARTNFVVITRKGEDLLAKALNVVTKMETDFFKTETGLAPDIVKFMQLLLPEC